MFARLDPVAFQTCFRAWVHALGQHLPDDVVAIDGKTLRRTHDAAIARSPLHLVSAWSTVQGLVLGQLEIDAKTANILSTLTPITQAPAPTDAT
ncbi:ISAs1 family transposase [Chloroflexia bacterium SDU3-3]|nr:ISAs1 family transposase [Chloroflexia bacterium SDU3-3]